jgi:zinc transport system substrate-binding protein
MEGTMMATRTWIPSVLVVGALACGPGGEAQKKAADAGGADAPLVVFTVNHPLAAMAGRIGGRDVEVTFPAPQGEDPNHWMPSAETIVAYQGADLILLNGAGYAKWVAQASLPASRLVDTGAAFADRLIPLEETVRHTHGPEGEHEHGGMAFTTWLDPSLALEQARAIAAAFSRARPDRATAFRERLELLEAELAGLDHNLEGLARAREGRPLLFSHPVYQYLERRYGLNGRSVHWEPDAEPIGREWRKLERLLAEHPAQLMIWEAEPLPSTRERLEEMGLRVEVFDPCASAPESGDYFSVMRENAERLRRAWQDPSGRGGGSAASPPGRGER